MRPTGHPSDTGFVSSIAGADDPVRPDNGRRAFWGGQSRPPLQPFNVPGVFTVRAVEDAGPYGILPYPFVGGGVPDAPRTAQRLLPSHRSGAKATGPGGRNTPRADGAKHPYQKNRYLYESHLTARRKIAILQYHKKYHSAVKTGGKGEQYDP